MKLAFDVQYYETYAKSVCIVFNDWQDETPSEIIIKKVHNIAPYVPGEFYKRELPCIEVILEDIHPNDIELIIVDGYVYLNDDKKLGLGGYLYEKLNNNIPIIGVAKSSFHDNKKYVREVIRGESTKPLYITAVGLDVDKAKNHIQKMHGEFRMPSLLQILDSKTKEK
ncbi:endonuclease V [uncultured Aquimarina sp.]|uniref:endonuclease V n=1 Tax=uncultured Aquimarina sp. TaxID=575652 RepID=UPI0026094309|nr:endonuclease V [uncultured Aquimarina sp.]